MLECRLFDRDVANYWAARGREDARRGRHSLMYPTADGGVRFDGDPPDDWSPAYARNVARVYWNAFLEASS